MSTALQVLSGKMAAQFGAEGSTDVVQILKQTAFRSKVEPTDAQMTALMIVASVYNLNPFTKEIYAYSDKNNGIVPIVGVDGWTRIINSHLQIDGVEFKQSDNIITPDGGKPCPEWMECIIYRKDRTKPTVIREYLDEVYKPPLKGVDRLTNKPYLINTPWQTHTKRFLRHKALIQCARLALGFVGIYDQDEADRIIQSEIEINPVFGDSLLQTRLDEMAKANNKAELNAVDVSKFTDPDELDKLRKAYAARINELRARQEQGKKPVHNQDVIEGSAIQDPDWKSLIDSCQTQEALTAVYKSMSPNDQEKWNSAVDEHADFLGSLVDG